MSVINESSITEVGGFIIPLVYYNGYFRYEMYFKNFRKPINIEYEANGVISFGTTEDGSYSVNFTESAINEYNYGNYGRCLSKLNLSIKKASQNWNDEKKEYLSLGQYLIENNKTFVNLRIPTNQLPYLESFFYIEANLYNQKKAVEDYDQALLINKHSIEALKNKEFILQNFSFNYKQVFIGKIN